MNIKQEQINALSTNQIIDVLSSYPQHDIDFYTDYYNELSARKLSDDEWLRILLEAPIFTPRGITKVDFTNDYFLNQSNEIIVRLIILAPFVVMSLRDSYKLLNKLSVDEINHIKQKLKKDDLLGFF